MTAILRIAITAGEPAGVGPDIVVQLAQQAWPVELVVLADPDLLQARAQQLSLPLQLIPYDSNRPGSAQAAGTLNILPIQLAEQSQPGVLNIGNAPYVLETLQRAGEGCLRQEFAAVVTAPVHKAIINQAGFSFTGHTEFFAQLTASSQVVMLLVADQLRVALATTHLPLAKVAAAITPTLLRQIIQVLEADLKRLFKISNPRILVCGLNPHAGENGHLGDEEIKIIAPVLDELRNEGINCIGPLSADTIFTPAQVADADAILAMYHDQGLPVLKYAGFGRGVNVTLGLPIIRTSVDHGTALNLAGTGKAEAGSLRAALALAIQLAQSHT